MLLASKWDAGWDLVHLLIGVVRIGFGSLPEWIRYPVAALGGAFFLYCVGIRCRDWWRARRSPADGLAETRLDT
ncbi:hypothetical protein [Streptomyces sp. NPDC050600]|uniref:hypothetical protein n=1 Tax=Streptomyces sp. NPDC050600 TaxID=3157213 RepID=UPI00342E0052